MSAPLVKVSDVCEQIRGVSYSGDDAIAVPESGYLAVLRANNITDEGLSFDDLTYVPEARISAKQLVIAGDVVIAASSGSLSVVGKAAPAMQNLNMGFGAFCKVLRPNSKVDHAYFAHFFKTRSYRKKVSSLAAGANINNLRNEHLDDLLFPLPPLEEQRRIAVILDQAETLRTQRRTALALLDSLTQSLFLDMFGDPVTNPKGWKKHALQTICEAINDCPHSTPEWTESGVVCLRTSNLTAGEWDWKDTRYVSEDTFHERSKRGYLRPGDIVLSREGTVGIAAIVQTGMELCMGQRLVQLRPDPAVLAPEYLLRHLLYVLSPSRISQLMVGSTSQHLNVKELRALQIPLPPLPLQQTFATRIASIEALKATHRRALAALDALFASLQQRAFAGQL